MNTITGTTKTVRWRLNDPAEENKQRWTKTHKVSFHASDLTACHQLIPEYPYMMDTDDQIPQDWPVCKRCQTSNE